MFNGNIDMPLVGFGEQQLRYIHVSKCTGVRAAPNLFLMADEMKIWLTRLAGALNMIFELLTVFGKDEPPPNLCAVES
jgi:hypothetical protein